MKEFKMVNLIPESSLNLVKFKGTELINTLGKEVISNVVSSILRGDNIRSLTENLTRRRILLTNASLIVTYLNALKKYNTRLGSNISKYIVADLKTKGLSDAQKTYLKWFIGLTGKSLQNVLRDKPDLGSYVDSLDKTLKDINIDIKKIYGELTITVEKDNEGVKYLLQWPDIVRCMLAIGSSTLTVRGSEKSGYGKMFEKFVLGSVLSLLGFRYISSENTTDNTMVFWLSHREDKRESDATALLSIGRGIRFDIGFIGRGNTEISLDKVTRFGDQIKRGEASFNTKTIILVDKIGDKSRTERMAKDINGEIIQMSGTYWVKRVADTIKKEFKEFKNPFEKMNDSESINYIEKNIPNIDLNSFLSDTQNSDL